MCGDPPQPQVTVHFEANWWRALLSTARGQRDQAEAQIAKAEAHLRLIGGDQ